MKKVTLIKGDGIGPEITDSVMKIINAAGVAIDWDVQTAGADLIETEGTPLPQRVLDSVKQNKIALKSTLPSPRKFINYKLPASAPGPALPSCRSRQIRQTVPKAAAPAAPP